MTVFPLWGGRRNPAAFFAFLGACRGDWRSKGAAYGFLFAVSGNDGFPFKANIRTILENNPAGLLWCSGYIYFGRKVLCDLVCNQQVKTFLEISIASYFRQIEPHGEAGPERKRRHPIISECLAEKCLISGTPIRAM